MRTFFWQSELLEKSGLSKEVRRLRTLVRNDGFENIIGKSEASVDCSKSHTGAQVDFFVYIRARAGPKELCQSLHLASSRKKGLLWDQLL